jgi:hypothetical protein
MCGTFSKMNHILLLKGVLDEWIKKMWYLYKMEFNSATKKNEIFSFTGK